MKKKIFLRFFSVTLCAVLLMFAFGVLAVHLNATALMQERLREETELVASFLHTREDFADFEKYENDDAFRVTVLDTAGNVLYESDTRAPLENHADREEIKNALLGAPAASERYSETLGFPMTYYAVKTELASGEEVLVRLAVKSSRISAYLFVVLPILLGVLILSLLLSLFVSGALSGRISAQFVEIGDSLKSLNEGDYRPIRTDSREPELFTVLCEINALSESTHQHMQSISAEHGKLTTVLENISQGIIAVDADRRIAFVNRSALALFGADGSVGGQDLVYLIDDATLCERIGRHLGEEYQGEFTYREREYAMAIRRIAVGGTDTAVSSIVILTDITADKSLQKQKSEFFANASHELKTPITVIQGLSELLLSKDALSEKGRERASRIHAESLRLTTLVSDMLRLSRLENGEEASVSLSQVELSQVAQESAVELSEALKEKNISLEIRGMGSVMAEEAKIYEILQNLLSNAVHYNKENGRITVGITEQGESVTLKVSDTGIGIAREHLPRLCERFYRVDKSRSKKTGGTGLGLAIVKHICARYHAELLIESKLGEGTEVKIVFPKVQPTASGV